MEVYNLFTYFQLLFFCCYHFGLAFVLLKVKLLVLLSSVLRADSDPAGLEFAELSVEELRRAFLLKCTFGTSWQRFQTGEASPPPCSVPLWFAISGLIAAAAAGRAEGVSQAGWHGMGANPPPCEDKAEGLHGPWYLPTGCWRTFKV